MSIVAMKVMLSSLVIALSLTQTHTHKIKPKISTRDTGVFPGNLVDN